MLMSRILRCDYDGVKRVFLNLEHDQKDNMAQIQSVLAERRDGNRNILHACVNMCLQSSNKTNEQNIKRELMTGAVDGSVTPMEEPIPPLSWPPELDNTSGEEDSLSSIGAASIYMMNKSGTGSTSNNTYVTDSTERRNNALLVLKYMCENAILALHLKELLSAQMLNAKHL